MVSARHILLASGSPRRKQLLEAACYAVQVKKPAADESWPGGEAEAAVVTIASRKLDAIKDDGSLTLAADTIVVLDETPLGKPADANDARRMLSTLSAREHRVITGYCVRRGERHARGVVSTAVSFRSLGSDEIDRYVNSGEPMDKAGAYGIQGLGGALVDRVEGSYTNVVGLPLAEVLAALDEVAA
jgi:septum formation protein